MVVANLYFNETYDAVSGFRKLKFTKALIEGLFRTGGEREPTDLGYVLAQCMEAAVSAPARFTFIGRKL